MATLESIAAHLDMTERNLRDVLKKINLNHRKASLTQIRVGYIRHVRNQAAGRGGDEQQTLTKARTEESEIKSKKLRVEYLRDIGSLISAEDAASVITLWCRQANTDYTQGFHKLVSEIQSRHKIKVDNELVESIVIPTTERIEDHAQKLGEGLIEGINDLSETEGSGDS